MKAEAFMVANSARRCRSRFHSGSHLFADAARASCGVVESRFPFAQPFEFGMASGRRVMRASLLVDGVELAAVTFNMRDSPPQNPVDLSYSVPRQLLRCRRMVDSGLPGLVLGGGLPRPSGDGGLPEFRDVLPSRAASSAIRSRACASSAGARAPRSDMTSAASTSSPGLS